MVKYCPKCKVIMTGNYCFKCGTELKECPKCPGCGNYLYPADKYCSDCGERRPK